MSATAYTNEAMQEPYEFELFELMVICPSLPTEDLKEFAKTLVSNKKKLSRLDYANAQAAGFDMDQFEVAATSYVRC